MNITNEQLFWCSGHRDFHPKNAFGKATKARGKNGKAGIQPYCKEYKKQYKRDNKEHIQVQEKEYRNRPEIKAARKQYEQENKEALRESERQLRASIRQFVIALKTDKPCFDCGSLFPYYCMDFDHMDGYEKCFNIGDVVANKYSKEKILAETAKCQLICANCHKLRTYNRRKEDTTIYIYATKERNDKKKEKALFIIDQYRSQPCLDCHKTFSIYCMEFDHIGDDKIKPVSMLKLYSEETLIAEINKCEVVCVNCHRIRTFTRKEKENEESKNQ